jgi:hypothetical protein
MGLVNLFKCILRPFKVLLRPFEGLMKLFEGLMRPVKNLTRLAKSLIRLFQGLMRRFKATSLAAKLVPPSDLSEEQQQQPLQQRQSYGWQRGRLGRAKLLFPSRAMGHGSLRAYTGGQGPCATWPRGPSRLTQGHEA